MSMIGQALSLMLLVCLTCFIAEGEVRAQGKKSDAVVKIKTEADKPNADGTINVRVNLTIDKGWHIYANPVGLEDQADMATVVTADGKAKIEKIDYPAGKLVKDKVIGDYKVYENKITIQAKVRRSPDGSPIDLLVKFQACNDSKCLIPTTVKASVP